MSTAGWLENVLFLVLLVAVTPLLGAYMYHAFESKERPFDAVLGRLERFLERLGGFADRDEQTWAQYTGALLAFSAVGVLVTYALQRLQFYLPFNPQGFAAVSADSSFNTAASFTTNTNWQGYTGESTMSYLTQMAGLAWHNFTSAAAGIGVALALARGFTRRFQPGDRATLGNFWVDLNRAIVYVLLPLSFVSALVLVEQGCIQNMAPYVEATTLEGAKQVLPMGPVASQEAIKQLGTNGGGFFNANSAHPYENPTPISNFFEIFLIFAIPAALTFTYGRMCGDQRQGWALFGAMAILFVAGLAVCTWAEHQDNPVFAGLGLKTGVGNLEGKELRFGIPGTTLFACVTTGASCGAVNGTFDSFNALGGMVPLLNIQLGEAIFGGVGAGLYGILVNVVLAVFIAGLMVGRTPEYLGKKIEGREMKLAVLYILIFPLIILFFTAWACVASFGLSSLNNAGPHGLTEILYAFTSCCGNNGSAFAGLNANTPFYNLALGFTMLAGRFWMIIPALGIAGSMAGKKTVPQGPGSFPTDGPLFTLLLTAVIVIVGALTFFPALCLGPIVEHFVALSGTVY